MNIFQSNFVFGLQGNLYQDFLDNIAHPVIKDVIGVNNYEIINFDKHFSLLDFDKSRRKESIFPEFYLHFLDDISKDNNQVSFKKKVCITLDERLCDRICPKTNRKITVIQLGGVDLAYFIYFDVKEFFDFVYGNEFQEGYRKTNKLKKDTSSSNKLIGIKIENIDSIGECHSNVLDVNVAERIGYIHNINNGRGFSFVHDTKDGNSGFPIYYRDFPEVANYAVGTPIKAEGYFNNDGFFCVDSYEIIELDELPFDLMELNGTLKIYENSNFTIIRTKIGGVYTSLDLVKEYTPNVIHQVECIAIESYDQRRQENGWKAIWVGDSCS